MSSLRVADFDFALPEELIAQHPRAERGLSRMLVVDRASGSLRDASFAEFPTLLQPGDLLVLNDSRVIPARLYARRTLLRDHEKPTGRIEVLLTEPAVPQMPHTTSCHPERGRRISGVPSDRSSSLGWQGDRVEGPASRHSAEGAGNPLASPPQPVPGAPSLRLTGVPADRSSSVGWSGARVGNHEPNLATDENLWRALVRPGRKIAIGERLLFSGPNGKIELEAEVLERGEFGDRLLRFKPVDDFFAVLDRIGHMPLPPYIRRNDEAADRERYQTVYSHQPGSVAAPTAGLHFTPQMLDALTAKGVEIARITLHVGLGTFAPLRVDSVDEVRLHRERYTLSASAADAVNRAASQGRRIVAVGTTVVRTLEHCAQQARGCHLQGHSGTTEIFISPGFEFRLVGALLTNFHLPQSSLLMLVSAFAGRERVLAAYAHAVREKYRFFSYGDCMFIG